MSEAIEQCYSVLTTLLVIAQLAASILKVERRAASNVHDERPLRDIDFALHLKSEVHH